MIIKFVCTIYIYTSYIPITKLDRIIVDCHDTDTVILNKANKKQNQLNTEKREKKTNIANNTNKSYYNGKIEYCFGSEWVTGVRDLVTLVVTPSSSIATITHVRIPPIDVIILADFPSLRLDFWSGWISLCWFNSKWWV